MRSGLNVVIDLWAMKVFLSIKIIIYLPCLSRARSVLERSGREEVGEEEGEKGRVTEEEL